MVVATRGSIGSADTMDFSAQVAALSTRIDCRRADNSEERQAIFRLRYQAYLRAGAIPANPFETFTDTDDQENGYLFGLFIDDKLASTLRLHVGSRINPKVPSLEIYPDLLAPLLAAGRVIVDTTCFVADERLSSLYRCLPYFTLRPSILAAEYFHADDLLVAARSEHQAFYRRAFNYQVLCEPRRNPQLLKPLGLLTLHLPSAAEQLYQKYPFFRSSVSEQRKLFERQPSPKR
jgi:hypothetical protein